MASDGAGKSSDSSGGTGVRLVDGWTALDRGWQALALGLGIVVVHAVVDAFGGIGRLGLLGPLGIVPG